MNNKFRVSWLFVANDDLVQRVGRSVKPLGTADAIYRDFDSLDEAKDFRKELLSFADKLGDEGLYVELSPYIFSPNTESLG